MADDVRKASKTRLPLVASLLWWLALCGPAGDKVSKRQGRGAGINDPSARQHGIGIWKPSSVFVWSPIALGATSHRLCEAKLGLAQAARKGMYRWRTSSDPVAAQKLLGLLDVRVAR
jgi:hypothetical protein